MVVAVNDREIETLMVCAFRYAIGRKTYIVNTIADILIEHKDKLGDGARLGIVRDIHRDIAIENVGMECDKREWLRVLEALY